MAKNSNVDTIQVIDREPKTFIYVLNTGNSAKEFIKSYLTSKGWKFNMFNWLKENQYSYNVDHTINKKEYPLDIGLVDIKFMQKEINLDLQAPQILMIVINKNELSDNKYIQLFEEVRKYKGVLINICFVPNKINEKQTLEEFSKIKEVCDQNNFLLNLLPNLRQEHLKPHIEDMIVNFEKYQQYDFKNKKYNATIEQSKRELGDKLVKKIEDTVGKALNNNQQPSTIQPITKSSSTVHAKKPITDSTLFQSTGQQIKPTSSMIQYPPDSPISVRNLKPNSQKVERKFSSQTILKRKDSKLTLRDATKQMEGRQKAQLTEPENFVKRAKKQPYDRGTEVNLP